ncbi:hypothetical protein FQR65_LT18792 [Abscondita terminalis]|nr:hypothetical protein FQR65_LT18792 [Abscondita terminalis]
MLSRYRGKTTCPTCEGLRLREESSWVKIDGHNIQSMVELPLDELLPLIQSLNLNEHDAAIAKRLVYEIVSRLEFFSKSREIKKANTLTSDYLNGVEEIAVPKHRRKPKEFIHIKGARENNLKNVDVDIPLESLVVVTGVSGSGKSTLMKDVLAQAVQIELGIGGKKADFDSITFPKKLIQNIEMIDQNPIGKSSRSNPVTYLKAYDDIRDLFAKQKMSKHMGLKAKHFSFNVDGGRCDECKGEGVITVSMQFMADIELQCETCHGTRFKDEILDVKFDEKNISDILNLTVNEALDFFRDNHQDKNLFKN